MGTFLFISLLILLLAATLWIQSAAGGQEDVMTPLSPEEVAMIFRRLFISSIHTIEVHGDTIAVRPKLKKYAPTLSMSATPAAGGTEVSIWTSQSSSIYGLRIHAVWLMRKKRKFLARLPKVESPALP